jgi:hypothetical protein
MELRKSFSKKLSTLNFTPSPTHTLRARRTRAEGGGRVRFERLLPPSTIKNSSFFTFLKINTSKAKKIHTINRAFLLNPILLLP